MAIPGAVQNMGNSVPTTTSVFSTCWLGKARRENNAQAALHREVHRFAGCFAELLQIWRCPADQFVGLNVMAAQGQRSGGEFETPGLRVLGQLAEPGQGMRETLNGALAHSVERGHLFKAQGVLAAAECVYTGKRFQ